ncbi:hypothetical protein D3C73_1355410 [compost metagenome]
MFIAQPQRTLRRRKVLIRCFPVQGNGPFIVLTHTISVLIAHAQIVLGHAVALIGRLGEPIEALRIPGKSFLIVLIDAIHTAVIPMRQAVLSFRISALRPFSQSLQVLLLLSFIYQCSTLLFHYYRFHLCK